MAWLVGWDKRIKLTIDHTKVDAALSHFPVTVFLSSTHGSCVFDELTADADYIKCAFTKADGVTELYAEKEMFEAGEYTSQYPPAQSGTYVKVTTEYSAGYWAYFATNPDKSLTGVQLYNSWISALQTINNRFHIDLGSAKVVKKIYYENFHDEGIKIQRGVQNFTFWGSNTVDSFNELTYGTDTGWTELTCSNNNKFDIHIEADQTDPKYITVTNSTAYKYYAFKFVDTYGDTDFIGIRRIELQVYTQGAIYHVSRDSWSISSSVDTDFYMYYDIDHADNTTYIGDIDSTPGHAVYDSNFKFVCHMVDVTTSSVKDSTSNGNDGTKKGANEPVEAAGKVGQGQDFDGSNDYITLPASAGLYATDAITIESACHSDTLGTTWPTYYGTIFSTRDSINSKGFSFFFSNDGGVKTINLLSREAGGGMVITGAAAWADDTAYYIALTHVANTSQEIWRNDSSLVEETNNWDFQQGVNNPKIGQEVETDQYYWNGVISELRISDTKRADAWIKATYNSLWDTLLTYGSEEEAPVTFIPRIIIF